jgi:hypothetical protein
MVSSFAWLGQKPFNKQSPGMTISRSTLVWLIQLAIGLAILYYIFTFIPFTGVVSAISSASIDFLVLALVVIVIERLSASARIKILTDQHGMGIKFSTMVEINLISTFYSMFLPGVLAGGAVRWYKMSRPNGKRAEAFAAIAFERLIDTIMLLIFLFVFWFLDVHPTSTPLVDLIFVGMFSGLLIMLLLCLSDSASVLILKPLELFRKFTIARFAIEKIGKVLEAVRHFRKLSVRAWVSLLLLTFVRNILSLVIMYLFVLSLAMNVEFITLGWIRSLINIVTMLPVSYAGLGVREASLVYLMTPYGIPGNQVVAFSFLVFMNHGVLAVTGGVLEIKNVLSFRWPKKNEA